MFWLSYECFSILCHAFLLKSAISRHNSCAHCVILLYCETFSSYWVYTVKDFIGYLLSLYYCCFTCLRLAKPKVQLKVSYWNTESAIPEKFSSFLLYTWKLIILNPTPFPVCLFFFHYSACSAISDCNHPFDKSTFTHTVSQEYVIVIENTYLNGVFLKSKISVFP